MKPINVALFVKTSPWAAIRDQRNMGMWSYPVEEFTWKHFYANNFEKVDRAKYRDYDVIFHEDAGWAEFYNQAGPPVIYYAFDSFLTEDHRAVRLKQAGYANLVLVDHDDLNTFEGIKAKQWPYATNDRLFVPLEKTVDVVYHCSSSSKNSAPKAAERSQLRKDLGEICAKRGWSYVSGALSPADYSASMGRAKVVVNLTRNWLHRPHRAFDAMACKAAYLSDPSMVTPEDIVTPGRDYATFESVDAIEDALDKLLSGGAWREIAQNGYDVVTQHHTWEIRAKELRDLIAMEFGI